ncbi:MAG: hypothetical protein VR72_20010 [Clostridiaceae bacterium BRH_c20a]|nr:MAG: hypothetical protein VR72_20010 [Clostridiaceae bacterium BRH_c20a]
MYRPNNQQGVTYVWNNAEGLLGDDITFLVCRALVKLPPARRDVGEVVGINSRNIVEGVSWNLSPKAIIGRLLVDLNLELPGEIESTELVKLALPYRTSIKSLRMGEVVPEVKYIYAKKVGVDSILVEGIITLASLGYLPWRSEVDITGEFSGVSTIKVGMSLPEIKETVSAQVRFILSGHKLEDSLLTVSGWKETFLMYISGKSRGEQVVVTQQVEPFTESIMLNTKVQSIGALEVSSGSLRTSVLDKREVLVEGDFFLIISPGFHIEEAFAPQEVMLKVKELVEKVQERKKEKKNEEVHNIKKEVKIVTHEKEEVPASPKEGALEIPDKTDTESGNNKDNEIEILRVSRKDKLNKHLRKLKD